MGEVVKYVYNPLGQLTQMKDWLGITTIEVDALGRAKKVTDHEGKTVQYKWDALGRREEITYPDESKVGYQYNAAGHLEQVHAPGGETAYRYDAMGRVQERRMPGGLVTQYVVDSLGRLESLTHQKSDEVLDQFRYSYDPAGNITEIDKFRAGVESDSGLFRYTYDAVGRLTQASNDRGG